MCPICDSNNFSVTGNPKASREISKKLDIDKYKVVQCKDCCMYYVNPKIDFSLDEWKILYGNDYFVPMTKWHKRSREKDRINRFDNILKYAKSEIKNFLDVGCGEGFTLIEAENRGWTAYGLDIEDNRINGAKKDSINFINSDLINADLPIGFFDVVYMDSVLEHVTNPFAYLSEICRVLKEDGILYIGIPNENSLINDVKKIVYKLTNKRTSPRLKPFQSPYHIVGFNMASILFALKRANLKVSKIRIFACRTEFLKSRLFSKQFFKALLLFPISVLAAILRKEAYLEAYIKK